MGLHVRYEIRCDHCPEMDTIHFNVKLNQFSITAYKDRMRKQGWTIGRTICCPKCIGKGKRRPPGIICVKEPWQNPKT
jgi:hypothetical protein